MKITVRISLKGDERLLRAVHESLVPDNVEIPEGMEVDMKLSEGELKIEISGDERIKIDTLISTLDEVLEACSMIEKAMEEVGDARSQIR